MELASLAARWAVGSGAPAAIGSEKDGLGVAGVAEDRFLTDLVRP
jgi:hypothetical protein